jgi:hypothetical protein
MDKELMKTALPLYNTHFLECLFLQLFKYKFIAKKLIILKSSGFSPSPLGILWEGGGGSRGHLPPDF